MGAIVKLLRSHKKDHVVEDVLKNKLTKLDFFMCPIRDAGAEIVSEFLQHNETVTQVHLRSCKIGSRGAKAIAGSFKHNTTVRYVDVRENEIDEESVKAVIEALNDNACIKEICLWGNRIAFESHASIQYLTETRNAISIPAIVRRASLSLIVARREVENSGDLLILPKEIVKMIAIKVWETRRDSKWIEALSDAKELERESVEKFTKETGSEIERQRSKDEEEESWGIW